MSFVFRFWLIIIILIGAVVGVFLRLADLMIVHKDFLLNQGEARSVRVINVPAYRGMITDRNGYPLAISVPVVSIWVNPLELDVSTQQLNKLAQFLEMSAETIREKLKTNNKKTFLYLKRGLTPYLASRIEDLKIEGLYLQRGLRRFYPDGEVTAHLIGLTNVDDQGQEGIELQYNDWLGGMVGQKRVLIDRLGNVIANLDLIRQAVKGHNITLSIDRRLQYVAYRYLNQAILENKAQSGSVVLMDTNTGEVLAMVAQPSYNPNDRPKNLDSSYRNRAVTDVFEPGSTLKAFSVANALISGRYTPSTPVDTNPGSLIVDNKRVVEIDGHNYGLLDVAGVLRKSSNVGVTKLTLSLPPPSLPALLSKLGFGERTDSTFPGESTGVLPKHPHWHNFALATLSFGYGISVTTLQLAQAYSVLANQGKKIPVSLLRLDAPSKGKQIISPKIAQEMVSMLQSVSEGVGGTAGEAKIPGYHVSGKTGTARMVGPHGYLSDRHNAIFVGIAPSTKPRLVMAVVIQDPRNGKFYAGQVAAPVFAKIMGEALRILNIAPDNI
jgi:cell division protein FtsI (penicillin-binding protein 3)